MSEWKAKRQTEETPIKDRATQVETRVTEIERCVDDLNAALVRAHGAEQGADAAILKPSADKN